MKSDDIKVSVVIPVYNGGVYICETLESVLTQTFKPLEVIVIDSSDDESPGILKSFSSQICYFFQPRQGISSARNSGVKKARGNFLAHLDSDDIWAKEKLELQAEAFLEDPDLDIVGGLMEPFYSPELTDQDRAKIYCPPEPLPGFSASVITVKKGAFMKVGFYDTALKVGPDLDWFVRAREQHLKEKMIQRVLVRRRLHKTNTDILNRQYQKERVQVLKASLDRRRKGKKNQT